MIKKRLFTFWLLLGIGTTVSMRAQKISDFQKGFQYNIQPASNKIKIDGVLDEGAWTSTEIANRFNKKFPNDIGEAKQQTEVRITYDNENIYFAFKVYDSGTALIKGLKRDIGHDGSDGVGIILDPQNKKTNGFFFVVSALNVQSDDQLSNSYDDRPSWSWDSKWFSATKDYGTYWIAEIMIPLKSIRYDPKQLHWGLNFLRIDAKNNEYSTWSKVPAIFRSYDLGYSGMLNWPTTGAPVTSKNIIFLPYVNGNSNEDKENGKTLTTSASAGFDSKIALNASLNLDLTVNPDFSQVEVDQQVTNLTRFNIFLPERRNFFLENSDLFSNFGIPPIRPFYSRTIGLDKEGNRIPILFGARLSGNLNAATRIGVMNMQTGKQGNYSPENFSAFTMQRSVLKRSVIKTYFLNRENYISEAEAKKNPLDKYGRNAGVTFEYSNSSGSFSAWADYHQAFKPTVTDQDKYVQAGFMSSRTNWSFITMVGNVGKNYYTDMGFVQMIENYDAVRDTSIRMGFGTTFNQISYKIMPATGPIGKLQFNVENFANFHQDNSLNQSDAEFGIQTEFKNTSSVSASLGNTSLNLLYPISFTDATPLPAGFYSFNQFEFKYNSDMRKLFGISGMFTVGQFYNGTVTGGSIGLSWRSQPHFNVSVRAEMNKIELPKPYGNTNLILISPKVEWNFSTQLFWTTFMQYNTQQNNFNINSRLQYRFKPMSDFFLVYTDNYFTDPMLKNKNRALIFKFSYWFNL
jgi:hypothetical protein